MVPQLLYVGTGTGPGEQLLLYIALLKLLSGVLNTPLKAGLNAWEDARSSTRHTSRVQLSSSCCRRFRDFGRTRFGGGFHDDRGFGKVLVPGGSRAVRRWTGVTPADPGLGQGDPSRVQKIRGVPSDPEAYFTPDALRVVSKW